MRVQARVVLLLAGAVFASSIFVSVPKASQASQQGLASASSQRAGGAAGDRCRAGTAHPPAVLLRLPQRAREDRGCRFRKEADPRHAGHVERPSRREDVGAGRAEAARRHDAAGRNAPAGSGDLRVHDRVARRRARFATPHPTRHRQVCIVSTGPSTRTRSATCSTCRSTRRSTCRRTIRRPASTTSPARSASPPRWSKRM